MTSLLGAFWDAIAAGSCHARHRDNVWGHPHVIRTHRAVLVSLNFSGSSWLTVPNQTLL